MKRKWLLIVSVMMALVLALSLCLVGCNKGDDNNEGPGIENPNDPTPGPDDPTPTPGTSGEAVALIEDEDLEGKFFMMYTFEESEAVSAAPGEDTVLAAYDPYTGEAIPDYDGHYYSGGEALVSVPKANGGSKYVMNVNKNAIALGKVTSSDIKDTVDTASGGIIDPNGEHTGLSVSFWAYNYETLVGAVEGDLQADWTNVMTNGMGNKIAYGNIYVDNALASIVPIASKTPVGRGAYTEDSYAEAQQELTTSQLGFHNDYTGWNAVAGNKGATDEDGGLIDNIADAYLNTWRYITISLDYEDGISFYVNGRLAFTYTPDVFTGNKYPDFYRNYVVGMLSDYASMGNFYVDMFNAEAGLYADDVLVGASLTAEEACNLYEDLSGTTYEADDLTLESAMSGEEVAQAKADWIAENSATAKITAARQNFYENVATLTAGSIDSTGTVSYSDNAATFSGGDSTDYYKAANGASGYTLTTAGYHIGSVAESDITAGTDLLFFYNLQANLFKSDNTYIMNTDMRAYHWVNPGGSATVGSGNGSHTWSAWTGSGSITDINRFSWVEVELVWDGESDSVTLTYYIYYPFYADADIMNFQDSYQVTDYEGVSFEITKEDALYGTSSFTLTYEQLGLSSQSDLAGLQMRFFTVANQACYYVMSFTDSTAVSE